MKRQVIYLYLGIDVHSFNPSSSTEAMNFTYYEPVFVAVGIPHVMRMRHFAICDLPGSTIFFRLYLIKGTIFE